MKNFLFSLSTALTIPISSLFAGSSWDDCWHTVFGIESGVAITSNAGKATTFPIDAPITSEFYSYSPDHNTQAQAFYGVFVGVERLGYCSPWDIQYDLNYCQSSPFLVQGTLTQGVDVESQNFYSYAYHIIIRQLLVEGKFSYINNTYWQPYILVGIGPSFNTAYSFSTTAPPLLTLTRTYNNRTTTGFTYAIGVGLDFEILECVSAGISYRFTDFGKASLGSASIDGTPLSGTLSQSNFFANEVYFQLTFVF